MDSREEWWIFFGPFTTEGKSSVDLDLERGQEQVQRRDFDRIV